MRPSRTRQAAGVLGIAAITVVPLLFAARLQFDWFDMSAFLDAGWRVAEGREPYRDFYYIAQPLHLWMHALFFRLFGFGQNAVLAHLGVVHVAFTLLLGAWAMRRLPAPAAFLVTLTGAVAFSGPVAHPWYDLNAIFWMMAALVALDVALPPAGPGLPAGSTATHQGASAVGPLFRRELRSLLGAALAGVFCACAFLVKANYGLAAFLVVGGLLLLAPGPRLRPRLTFLFAAAAGASATFTAALLALAAPDEFIRQAFLAYPAKLRFSYVLLIYDVLTKLPYTWCIVFVLVAALVGGPAWRRTERRALLEALLLAVAALLGTVTGSLGVWAKFSLAGPAIGAAWAPLHRMPGPRGRVARGVLGLGTLAVLLLVLHASWPPVAWLWRKSNRDSDYAIAHATFRGWRTSGLHGPGIDRAARAIERHVPPDSTLLVLPDATMLTAMTGRREFPGAPIFYHRPLVPPPGPDLDRFRDRVLATPPDWILVRQQDEIWWCATDTTIRWLGIAPVFSRYEVAAADSAFQLHRRTR